MVFIAGGVGVNPIMSMISAMDAVGEGKLGGIPGRVRVLYTSRRLKKKNENGDGDGEQEEEEAILFEERMVALARKWGGSKSIDYKYTLFETQKGKGSTVEAALDESGAHAIIKRRRIDHSDLREALGPDQDRANTVVYVCGVPQMTDEFVDFLKKQPGMDEKRVLCEKWW